MAIVSRETIKGWFERKKKPTAEQFASLTDSFAHKSEDSKYYGLWEHNVSEEFPPGKYTIISNGEMYRCKEFTQGAFDPAKFDLMSVPMKIKKVLLEKTNIDQILSGPVSILLDRLSILHFIVLKFNTNNGAGIDWGDGDLGINIEDFAISKSLIAKKNKHVKIGISPDNPSFLVANVVDRVSITADPELIYTHYDESTTIEISIYYQEA